MRLLIPAVLLAYSALGALPAALAESPADKAGASSDHDPSEDVKLDLNLLGILRIPNWPFADSKVRWGIGAFFFQNQQTSLRSSFSQSTVTLRDLNTGTSSTIVVEGDPKLDNVKFDFELDLKGQGVYVPIALRPSWATSEKVSVYPTMGIEIAEVDVDFDIFDTTAESSSAAFAGNGVMWGVGVDLTARLCSTCEKGYFSDWSYWFRKMSGIDVARSAAFDVPGLEVLTDEVTLGLEVHEFSTRFGYYGGSIGRHVPYSPYTGVLYRRVDLDLTDRSRLFNSSLNLETDQESVSLFESETVHAIAGVEVRFSESLSGQMETFFGSGDEGVRFQVLWSRQVKRDGGERGDKGEEPDREDSERPRRPSRKEVRIATRILPLLNSLRLSFVEKWKNLPTTTTASGTPAYVRSPAERLLGETEAQLMKILKGRKLAPLRDYFRRLFLESRSRLGMNTNRRHEAGAAHPSNKREAARIASTNLSRHIIAALVLAAAANTEFIEQESFDTEAEKIVDDIRRVEELANRRYLTLDLCIKSTPDGAKFTLISGGTRKRTIIGTNDIIRGVPLGYHDYVITKTGFWSIEYKLELLRDLSETVMCTLSEESKADPGTPCRRLPGFDRDQCPLR